MGVVDSTWKMQFTSERKGKNLRDWETSFGTGGNGLHEPFLSLSRGETGLMPEQMALLGPNTEQRTFP
jgi:hypothetical protein